MSRTDQATVMLNALDDVAQLIAFHTGLRQQYIDQGWTPAAAECMVIELFRSANNAGVNC